VTHCLFMLYVPVTEHSHPSRPYLEILSLRSGLFPQGKSVTRIDLGKKEATAVSNSFLKKKHHYPPNNKRVFFHILSSHTMKNN